MIKLLYFRTELSGRDLAKEMGLPYSLIDPIVEGFKRSHIIGAFCSKIITISAVLYFYYSVFLSQHICKYTHTHMALIVHEMAG